MAYIILGRIANTISSSPAVGSEVIRYRDDVNGSFLRSFKDKDGGRFLGFKLYTDKN